MFYALFFPVLAALVLFLLFWSKKKGEGARDRIVKIFTVSFVVLSLLNVFLPDVFAGAHKQDALDTMSGNELHAVLRWLNTVSFTVLPIAVFQKNKYFEKIASWFCLPVALLNVACYFQYIEYYTAVSHTGLRTVTLFSQETKDFFLDETFRAIFFGLLCLCQLTALILLTCRNRTRLTLQKGEIKNLIPILLGLIYISLPIFVPQHLFGITEGLKMLHFSPVHLTWLVSIPLLAVVLYFGFRNKSYEVRYLLVLALAWALMMQFTQMFTASSELNIMKLPLQLCNLGSYFALFMLLKKSENLFHFTLIVNVVGAVIAFLVLDITPAVSQLSYLWTVHFVVEHTKVFLIPILCLALRIFKPIDMKLLKNTTIGFSIYYVGIFLLGTVSNGLYRLFEGEPFQSFFYCNHLYMFDKDIARGLVGFTDPLFDNWVIRFGSFEIYPLVQALVYVVFLAICLGVCLLIYALTKKQRQDAKNQTVGERT